MRPPRPLTRPRLHVAALLALWALAGLSACGPGSADGASGPAPGPPTRLVLLDDVPREGDGYRAWGLTGRNKPNGPQYRYRRWVPAERPAFIPDRLDGLELWIADPVAGGRWLALYRGEGPRDWRLVAPYRARLHGPDGTVEWAIDPGRFLSRASHLEIQDMRYDDGDLFFNEGCITYARAAGGRCSALLRVDPESRELVWRTRDLVSNDIFLVRGPVLITGYGFTAEPDSVFLLDRASGEVLDAQPLDTAHSYLELHGDTLHVVTRARHYRFLLR